MAEEFLTKTQAVMEICAATGYGKFIVDRKIDELSEQGKIVVHNDPGDFRKKRMSRTDIQIVIDALRLK